MTDPDPLLAAIRRTPADRTLRLAYADWLEEQGDPRHELIRVCEAMRDAPVYSDRYWELKARRNDLWPRCPIDWLEATGYDGSYYDPIFRDGVPDDWKGRWRLIREFTERWHGIPMPDVGGRQEEIRETEQRLGLTLSPSIREYVAYAHDVFPQDDYPMVHRDPYTMEPVPGHPAVSLLLQAEGDIRWAVLFTELADPDPPVHTYVWDHEYDGPDEARPFVPDREDDPRPSVSGFILNYALGYKNTAGRFSVEIDGPDSLPPEWDEMFPVRVADRNLYEGENLLADLYSPGTWGQRTQWTLNVDVRSGTPAASVPAFLWDMGRRGNPVGGFFINEAHRRDWDEWFGLVPPPPPDPPVPPTDTDDIPF